MSIDVDSVIRSNDAVSYAGCALLASLTQALESVTQQEQQHLEHIVPAATLAAAERAAEAKEQTTKPRRQLPDQAQIFVDGFAIGLAVLLEVAHTSALFVLVLIGLSKANSL